MNFPLLKQILKETPYTHDGVLKRKNMGFISNTSLSRLYTLIGKIDTPKGEVSIHMLNSSPSIIGTVKDIKEGEESNSGCFSLNFKKVHTLEVILPGIKKSKILQIDKAIVKKDYEGYGIASFTYSSLVKLGYTILSDTTQFNDGKQLWKRMATKAHLRDYVVYILDDTYEFYKKDGKIVKYDGSNIDDAEIWSKGEDYSKYHVLLVMKK